MNSENPIVDEVRERAMRISARYGHDLRAYAKHLKDVQGREPERVVEQPRVMPPDQRSKPAA